MLPRLRGRRSVLRGHAWRRRPRLRAAVTRALWARRPRRARSSLLAWLAVLGPRRPAPASAGRSAAACRCSCSSSPHCGSPACPSCSPRSGGAGGTASRCRATSSRSRRPWLDRARERVAVVVALAVGMVLARRIGSRWWIAGAARRLCWSARPRCCSSRSSAGPALRAPAATECLAARSGGSPAREGVRRGRRRGEARERAHGRPPNADAAGIGPTRRVVLYDTLLDGRFIARRDPLPRGARARARRPEARLEGGRVVCAAGASGARSCSRSVLERRLGGPATRPVPLRAARRARDRPRRSPLTNASRAATRRRPTGSRSTPPGIPRPRSGSIVRLALSGLTTRTARVGDVLAVLASAHDRPDRDGVRVRDADGAGPPPECVMRATPGGS